MAGRYSRPGSPWPRWPSKIGQLLCSTLHQCWQEGKCAQAFSPLPTPMPLRATHEIQGIRPRLKSHQCRQEGEACATTLLLAGIDATWMYPLGHTHAVRSFGGKVSSVGALPSLEGWVNQSARVRGGRWQWEGHVKVGMQGPLYIYVVPSCNIFLANFPMDDAATCQT